MMRAMAVAVAMMAGCAGGNLTALVASTATLGCDWAQTRGEASKGWRGATEQNPIMGTTPDPGLVDAYFMTAIIVNAVLWAALPVKARAIAPAAISLAESATIMGNVYRGTNVCGL